MTNSTNTMHDQVKLLLLDYVTGAIAIENLALVKSHLSECAECEEILKFIERVRSDFRQIEKFESRAHIDPERLVDLAEIGYSGTVSEEEAVITHLLFCKSCSRELAQLRELNRNLELDDHTLQPNSTSAMPVRPSIWSRSFAGYAVAATILLASIVVVSRVSRKADEAQFLTPVRLEQPIRSDTLQYARLARPLNGAPFLIELRLPAGSTRSVEINDSLGRTVWATSTKEFGTRTMASLIVPQRLLRNGKYRLVFNLSDSTRSSGGLKPTYYFEVTDQ
jgi:hypothetical protein